MRLYIVGTDIGGTFTDIVLYDETANTLHVKKVPTTTGDVAAGMLHGVDTVLREQGAALDDVAAIAHGSTVAVNALLERKGARTGLITTAGFRDVLEIRRQLRPALYDMQFELPAPLVPRDLRREVEERVLSTGEVLRPLQEGQIADVVDALVREGVDSIAVCLINAYLNPAHEAEIAEWIRERYPSLPVTLSSTVFPEYREYERTHMTVINAFLKPVMHSYIGELQASLRNRDYGGSFSIMQSDGGLISPEAAREHPARLISSGPAAGVIGCKVVKELIGWPNLITMDMGGTSTDISLIVGDKVGRTRENKVAEHDLLVEMIDVNSIGAGGGSIAYVDEMGVLQVGPESAGARPGPACYGHGGHRPTITDACLALGYLDPEYFLGGEMPLDVEASRCVLNDLAAALRLDPLAAALAVYQVAAKKMANSMLLHLARRGCKVDDFALMAFGGAGGMFACQIMRELGLARGVIPDLAGVLSAFGTISVPRRFAFSRTLISPVKDAPWATINDLYRSMVEEGRDILLAAGEAAADVTFTYEGDVRYVGQGSELKIELPPPPLGPHHAGEIERRFHAEYQKTYNYCLERSPVEVVTWRLVAWGRPPGVSLRPSSVAVGAPPGPRLLRRIRVPGEADWLVSSVYRKSDLSPGHSITGPAVLEDYGTTVVVLPGYVAEMDPYRNVLLRKESRLCAPSTR